MLPVVKDFLLNGELIGSCIRLHEQRRQGKDVIADKMEADFSCRFWNLQQTIVESLFQRRILPNFGVIGRAWLSNIDIKEIVLGVNQGKESQAESTLVVVEKAA